LGASVDRLELLQGDILTALRLDKILDPVDDSQMAIVVELSDITRLEPPIASKGHA
jgi:hypothetical protein